MYFSSVSTRASSHQPVLSVSLYFSLVFSTQNIHSYPVSPYWNHATQLNSQVLSVFCMCVCILLVVVIPYKILTSAHGCYVYPTMILQASRLCSSQLSRIYYSRTYPVYILSLYSRRSCRLGRPLLQLCTHTHIWTSVGRVSTDI